eukprot:TRINITY_DN211_c0_g1_i1.p1 TRINITY_DN211_c0_g1~~TRINITY_DN211_c0_g1_i1.p1  ORF type:complete len:149 (+),score=37.69 TRINITY_DN211_c0_g1_i1:155-601(+)
MSSGIAINQECVTAYNSLKLNHADRWITFKISDDLKEVVIADRQANAGGRSGAAGEKEYTDFVKRALPQNECRYAIYDFDFKAEDGGDRSKIVFVLWAPDSAKIKPKMMYTSSKDAIRKQLVGIGSEVQATDAAEIAFEAVLEKCLRK